MHDDTIGIAWIHGLFGDPTDWDPCVAAWGVRRGGPQRAIALPGHGGQPALALEAGAAFAEAAAQLWRQLPGDRRWRLVGYSMGGRLAMAMARAAPERCAGLVLVSAHPGLAEDDAEGRRARWRLDGQRAAALRAVGAEAFLRSWYQAPLFAPWVARVGLEAAVTARGHVDVEGAARCLERLSLGDQPRGEAAALVAALDRASAARSPPSPGAPPTLLTVAGALDTGYADLLAAWSASGAGRDAEARQPDPRQTAARHVTLDGCGHAVHLEAPEALVAALCMADASLVAAC